MCKDVCVCQSVCVCVAVNSHACYIWIVHGITDSNTFCFLFQFFFFFFLNSILE